MNPIVDMYDVVTATYQSQIGKISDPEGRDSFARKYEAQVSLQFSLIATDSPDETIRKQAQEINDLWVRGYKSSVYTRINKMRRSG